MTIIYTQEMATNEIYDKILKIIDNYFGEQNEDENAPTDVGGQVRFLII